MPNSLLKRTLVVSALVAVGATGVAAAPAQATGWHHDEPDNIAHRGASGEAPENTIPAIKRALRQDADFVEVEIQRTADGVLVAAQDLARTTNVAEVFPDRDPFVENFTLAELRRLDAGSWFGPGFAGTRIPTLDQVIDEVGYRNGLVIEVANAFAHPGIEQDLSDALLANPHYLVRAVIFDNLVVQSVSAPVVSAFHDLLPGVEVGVVYEGRPSSATLTGAAAWADRVDVVATRTDRTLIDAAHGLGLEIVVHVVDDEAQLGTFVGLGVDGIATSFPGLLDDVLD